MNPNPALSRRRLLGLSAALGLGGALSVAGCTWNDVATTDSSLGGDFFDGSSLHSVSLTLSDDAWDEVRSAWQQSSEKVWAEVTLTIDGTAYKRVGARLKGNSTLRQTANTAAPQEYPWLLRLDKFVDGQSHQGVTEFAIRVNRTTSALNEALALDLMGRAGLVTQRAAYAAVTVGDSAAVLRLVCEHPSEAWIEAAMSGTGRLYKAEASGDYSYRGDDPAAYEEVFDQEAGQEDLTPLTDFLRWINESSDADFAAGLPTRLDVESFATYLAFEDLVDNYDDIEGPGNNSYLWSDTASSRMTVLGWDHNLTFGVTNRPGGGGAGAGGGQGGPAQGGGPSPNRNGNILATRFKANATYAAAVAKATSALKASLITSGVATTRLDAYANLLTQHASTLVDTETLASEKAAVAKYLA